MRYRIDRMRAILRDTFKNLPRRAVLTVQYLGWRAFFIRVVTFPLRFTPWGSRLSATRATHWAKAREWYRRSGHDVTVVIPSYGDPHLTLACVDSIRATTKSGRVRIVVSDDGSATEHVARLQAHAGIDEVVAHPHNTGFAANCNRGFAHAGEGHDVVLLNNDVIAHAGWLELLQYGAYQEREVGIAGPKLLYPDGTIQSAGTHRNLGAPEWFDHRYRFKPSDFPPANIGGDMLAMTGAALYIKPDVLRELGGFDEGYGMAYEDVDLCLRCWEAGHRVLYVPDSVLTHHESKTRPVEPGQRELDSQRYFWERWGDFFDKREVRGADGRVRIIVATHDTGVGGGHRVLFQHMNGLHERGYDVQLWTLGGEPEWFDLKVPVRSFEDYGLMTKALDKRGRDQGRDLVADRCQRLARIGAARHPRLLRPGHRDLVLPRPAAAPGDGDGQLPPRVPLRGGVRVDRRPAARPRRRPDGHHARPRPRHLPPARRRPARGQRAARRRAHAPAQELRADRRRLAGGPGGEAAASCGCSGSSRRSAPSSARATSSAPPTPRSTSSTTRRPS